MLLAVHYRVMEYLGSLKSTQEAKVALGYRLGQLLRFFCALQTSPVLHNSIPVYLGCLPPIDSDLLGYSVLETSHYTKKEFKAYKAMNELSLDIWIITETYGTILFSHCLGCRAGLLF